MKPGKFYSVSPGNREQDVVVGYRKYLDMVRDLVDGKEVVKRAKLAVGMAIRGKCVAGSLGVRFEKAGFYVIGNPLEELSTKHMQRALKLMTFTLLYEVLHG